MPQPYLTSSAVAGAAEASQWLQIHNARKTVNDAAGSTRLLGGVFVVIGALLLFPQRIRPGLQMLALVNAMILIGPGVWYVLAAGMVRRLDRRATTVALRVAAVQGAAVATGLALTLALDPTLASRVSAPVLCAIFFMPALAALAHQLRRARDAMNFLGGGEVGFETLAPRPVIPLEEDLPDVPSLEEASPADADPPVGHAAPYGSDNFRGK